MHQTEELCFALLEGPIDYGNTAHGTIRGKFACNPLFDQQGWLIG